MAKWFQRLLPALAFAGFLAQSARAQVEGPVEQGLTQLAKQVVAKSKAAGKTTIAVLPFPNADGTCSVLSNFIADELIQSLFAVPDSGLEIVERAQLETLISELRLGASGLLNPETTKKLGSQSGVGALTMGTITVIGDTVRINARLIATDTGRAISAAAVDIPKVSAVNELLRQPVTTGPTCAPKIRESTSGATNKQLPQEQKPELTSENLSAFLGQWYGKVVQRNPVMQYPVILTLYLGKMAEQIGTIEYPSLACGGKVILREISSARISVEENLTGGPCLNHALVTLTLNAGGTLEFSSQISNVSSSAVLRKIAH